MWLTLKSDDLQPLRRQIYEQIKLLILGGDLKARAKLPSSRALSKELGVARSTVLEAYEQLLAEGYLETRHGSGTSVAGGIAAMRPGTEGVKNDFASVVSARTCEEEPAINFRSGIPALDAFPRKEWASIYKRTCERLPPSAFRYSEPAGVWELRAAVAAYLFRMRGIRVTPEQIMITSGSTQGLWLVSRLLRGTGTDVLVEDPVHRGLVEVVARAGYTVRGVRADRQGMDTSGLAALSGRGAGRIAFAYVTPSHQYPLGGILPVQRRQALIRFAREAGCLLVEDDYDSEFRYEGAPVSSLYELAPEAVVYLGSFSKILAPALRLGFAIVPDSLLESWRPEKMYTDVHTDALSQFALAEFINNGGLERHIWKMKKLYRHKRDCLLRNLLRHFAGRVEIMGESTGLHLTAAFPDINFTDDLLSRLDERGVRVTPVERYSLCKDGSHVHELIFGYSHLTEQEIEKGVAILGDVLECR